MARKFRVVDGCAVPASIAPYVYLVLRRAGQTANSIYRGTDAAHILERHGKHTQAWLYENLPAGYANPPGRSTHELRSDGVAYSWAPVGRPLEEWQQGVDSGSDTQADRQAIVRAGHFYGWSIRHPYNAGVELHHWNFGRRPIARTARTRARVIWLRARLPRR